MTFFVPRIQPGADGAWPNSSRVIPLPPPLDWSADKSGPHAQPISEAALLLNAGLPAPILQQITALALRWGVPLREAALSIGAVKSHAYTRELAARWGLSAARKHERVRLRVLDIPPPPFRHLSAALPMPSRRTAWRRGTEWRAPLAGGGPRILRCRWAWRKIGSFLSAAAC